MMYRLEVLGASRIPQFCSRAASTAGSLHVTVLSRVDGLSKPCLQHCKPTGEAGQLTSLAIRADKKLDD